MIAELIHAHHNRHLEDLPFWLDLAAETRDPLLELGCGTGRILIPLAQAGHRVVGVDHDLTMLKYLQAHIPPHIKPVPFLVIADIRRFNLAMQFPLIILPCNTFSTLAENERMACLRRISKHLKPGGVFTVSIPNPDVMKNLPTRSAGQVEEEFILPQTGNPVQVSSTWHRTNATFRVTWIYDHLLPDGRVERFPVETSHQMIPANAYLDEIKSVGMKVTGIYGDFDRTAYRQDSPDLIIVAAV